MYGAMGMGCTAAAYRLGHYYHSYETLVDPNQPVTSSGEYHTKTVWFEDGCNAHQANVTEKDRQLCPPAGLVITAAWLLIASWILSCIFLLPWLMMEFKQKRTHVMIDFILQLVIGGVFLVSAVLVGAFLIIVRNLQKDCVDVEGGCFSKERLFHSLELIIGIVSPLPSSKQ